MRTYISGIFLILASLPFAACHTDHHIGRAIRTAEDRIRDSIQNTGVPIVTVSPIDGATNPIAPPPIVKTRSGTYAYARALKDLPQGLRTEVAGIDISHWDGKIDWTGVSSEGIRFVYIKATEGMKYVDPNFARNWAGAGATSLHRGAYHYFTPKLTVSDQRKQAMNFIATVPRLKADDLPPMIDFEDDPKVSSEIMQARLFAFIHEIETAFGVSPLIYTSKGLYQQYLAPRNAFKNYEVWIAAYSWTRPELCDGRSMRIWQFTDKASIKGIHGNVDMDIFYTTADDLAKLIIKKDL